MFFVIELVAPGAFMLWLGLSALLVGIISLLVDWPWQYQLVAFAVFALASIPLWRRFARRVEKAGDQPFLNRRADAFVGREFTLEKPIVSGNGTVKIDDTIWRLAGPGLRRRQPRQGRARGCRDAGGGAGVAPGHSASARANRNRDPSALAEMDSDSALHAAPECQLRHARAQQIVQMHDADRRAVLDHDHGGDLR